MKKQFKILSLLLFLGLAITLIGCSKPVELNAPEITLSETVVSWEAVENATGYKVLLNDEVVAEKITTTSYDLKTLREASYKVVVVALGDDDKFTDSKESNIITVTPENKVQLEKGTLTDGKLTYKIKVQSNADVLGFEFYITYPEDKLSITEAKVMKSAIIPSGWVVDANIKDGKINIALTGLDPINVRLLQTGFTLEFTATADADISLTDYVIDNGAN